MASPGTTFAIRGARPDDAAFIMSLFELPHVRGFVLGPPSSRALLEGLNAAAARDDRGRLIIERDGEPFGIANYDVVDGWLMELRTIAVREQRSGAGTFVMNWLIERAFVELRLHRIFLEVVEENTSARALYERVGFTCEGCYRDGYRNGDGVFKNLIPYGMLAPTSGTDKPYCASSALR